MVKQKSKFPERTEVFEPKSQNFYNFTPGNENCPFLL